MCKIRLLSLLVLFSVGSFSAADEPSKASSPDETTIIGEFRRLRARIEVDDHGHAVSLMWEVGTKGSFTDKQLSQVVKLRHLKELWLAHTAVTDAGLVHLKVMKQLESMALICEYKPGKPTTITDLGLKHLSVLTNLQTLRLEDSDVTDAGLVHLKSLTNLQDLDLCGTEISDAGLVHLLGLKSWSILALLKRNTKKNKAQLLLRR